MSASLRTLWLTYLWWRRARAYERANPSHFTRGEPRAITHWRLGRMIDLWRYLRAVKSTP